MFKRTKKFIKKRYDLGKWIGLDQLKETTQSLKDVAMPPKSTSKKTNGKQTFEELITENKWTKKDIVNNIAYQRKLCIGFLIFCGALLMLGIYFFSSGNILGGIFGILFSILSLAYTYQSWISLEQLKQHKLKINIKESLLKLFKNKT